MRNETTRGLTIGSSNQETKCVAQPVRSRAVSDSAACCGTTIAALPDSPPNSHSHFRLNSCGTSVLPAPSSLGFCRPTYRPIGSRNSPADMPYYANKFDRESGGITPWTSTPLSLSASAEFLDHTPDAAHPCCAPPPAPRTIAGLRRTPSSRAGCRCASRATPGPRRRCTPS